MIVEAHQSFVLICWKPPSFGWVKVTMDDSCNEGGCIRCGEVIRGSDGESLQEKCPFARDFDRDMKPLANLSGKMPRKSLANGHKETWRPLTVTQGFATRKWTQPLSLIWAAKMKFKEAD